MVVRRKSDVINLSLSPHPKVSMVLWNHYTCSWFMSYQTIFPADSLKILKIMKPKVITVIPARGGSKGVPRKNIKLLNGKPLIAYTIEASLNSGVVEACVEKVVNEGFDSCITAFLPETYEWKWQSTVDKFSKEGPFEPEREVMKRVVRQDLPKVFHENGAFYITKTSLFREIGHRWGGKMAIVEMTELDSIQIDSEDQFWFIEQILKKRENGENK